MTDIPAGPRFPEPELRALASFFDGRANEWGRSKGEGAKLIVTHSTEAAQAIRDAIQAHDDMRERLLGQIAELRGQLGQRSAA